MLLPQGYNTFCLGKWHLSPSEENTPAGPLHRWPLGRGFERFYGFLGGETNQWYPDLTLDNGPTTQPKTPEEGYHLSEDLADQAIKFVLDAHVNAPEKPFFMYYAPGCAHAPHHVPKEWADRYAGKFDGGWDAYRETVFARQQEIGLFGPDVELSPRDPDVPEWSSLSADERRLYARMMEVYAGFVSHCDHHFGRILDIARADRRAREHADHGHLRQRRVGRGRRHRLVQRDALLQPGPRVLRGQPRAHRRPRRDGGVQPLPVGLGLGGRHAVPALEARDLPRRLDRPVHPGLAGGHRGPRRAADAVRARDRHGADRARRARRRAAGGDPRRRADAARGRQLRAHLRRARGRDEAHHAVLRDVRPPLDLPRQLARGLPVAGAGLHDRGQARPQVRGPDHAGGPRGARPRLLGALRHDLGPHRGGGRRRPAPRGAARDDRALVGGGREVQGAAARRVGAGAAGDGASADVQAAHALRLLPRRLGRPGLRGADGLQPPVLDRGRRRHPRRRRRRRAPGPGRRRRRLRPVREGRRAALPLQLRRSRPLRGALAATQASPRAGTRCATSSSRPARPTSPTARASRGAASSTSTARSSGRPTSRTRRRCSSSSKGSAAASTSAPRRPSTRRRSPSPARSASSRSTSRAS